MRHEELVGFYRKELGTAPTLLAEAPGRVNLIGEHTDYNEGFVFPAAIDRRISVVAGCRNDRWVRAYSINFEQVVEFGLDDMSLSETAPWSNYLRGVLFQLAAKGYQVGGFNAVVSGDVPVGAGLSSSAAFEVAVAGAMQALFSLEIDPVDLALLSQAAEREFVGVSCGIMDQFVSVMARAGSALFLDCRDLSYSHIPLPAGLKIVVCDTRVKRSLNNSEYNRRRQECESAAEKLKNGMRHVSTLRVVTPLELEEHRQLLEDAE